MNSEERLFLVGDNPFHGISHLSQERSRARGDAPTNPEYAAKLILIALSNGANGFMFSVSEKTLSILNILRNNGTAKSLRLYAIVPYAYEYVRLAIKAGGVTGLAKKIVKEIAFSKNFDAVASGIKGVIKTDLKSLIKMYLTYEVSRIRCSAGKHVNVESVLLHQLVTDMCLCLNTHWLFRSYIGSMLKVGVKPGFNTGNFTYLVEKFREWGINLEEILIAAPFNKIGFQMIPSKEECEKALATLPKPNVLAISILAAGYLEPEEAVNYIAHLPNIKGVAVGVSKEKHAKETFKLLREKLVMKHACC
jgi:hypothetical protein